MNNYNNKKNKIKILNKNKMTKKIMMMTQKKNITLKKKRKINNIQNKK